MPASHDHRACAARKQLAGDGFTSPGAEKHYPPDLELDPIHLDLDLALDLEAERCAGTATHTVAARRAGPTRLLLQGVDLEDLAVRDPDGHALTWQYDGQELAIEWAEPFAAGERRRAAVAYRVENPTSGLYFSRPTEAYPDAPWYAATDHETERARHWLPCVDLPNARPRLDFHLRAAARHTILANGELVDEADNGDGTKTAHWRLDYPCPSYLTCFAIGDFVRADDGDYEGIPVAYFTCAPHTEADLQRSFGRTRAMLAWMTEKLGMPFPFPKYFQFALPEFGGAMENISLVSWSDGFVLDETLAGEWTRLVDEINVHEMAHSYFGDAVVCRDYAHAWLKESWATYLEQVWFEDTLGEDERAYQYYRDAHGYFAEADERYQRPIVTREFNSSWDMYDAHLYPGGACRLHTLRRELGDETFWAGVRDYLARHAGGVVETDDFRRALEAHSGRSLGRLFDQWFHSPGYPNIKVSFRYDAKHSEGSFEIEQTQVDEKEGKEAFLLSTEVGWVIDGKLRTWPVKLEKSKQTVVVPMSAKPEQVRFDPGDKVLHKLSLNPGDGMLRTQLTGAADVTGRILAGRELAATAKRRNIEAIAAAYPTEPFWGVRVEWAKALGKAASEAAVEALAALLAVETDPRVLAPLMRAAGTYRDPRIIAAVEARLAEGLPYHATAAAYEALGAQRDQAPFELLTAAADVEGFGGIAQAGAFRALAASRHDDAIPILLERVAFGVTSNRARPAAVAALGQIGRVQSDKDTREEVVEQLTDLLRDPNQRVRSAAVGALQAMQAGEAIGALRSYGAPLSKQEQVRVDRAIAAIRSGGEPKPVAAEKELDELRDKLRKLGDTVQKLDARLKAQEGRGGEEDTDERPGSDDGDNGNNGNGDAGNGDTSGNGDSGPPATPDPGAATLAAEVTSAEDSPAEAEADSGDAVALAAESLPAQDEVSVVEAALPPEQPQQPVAPSAQAEPPLGNALEDTREDLQSAEFAPAPEESSSPDHPDSPNKWSWPWER